MARASLLEEKRWVAVCRRHQNWGIRCRSDFRWL